jgi:hypothetical protein
MSSDGTGPAGEAAVDAEPEAGELTAGGADAGQVTADAGHEAQDPWFGPGPKAAGHAEPTAGTDAHDAAGRTGNAAARNAVAGRTGNAPAGNAAAGNAAAATGTGQAEWFLPAGRAGLLPDSMTVSSDDAPEEDGVPDRPLRTETAGEPPWAGDVASPVTGSPPPWESGPWPGPGEARPAGRSSADQAAGAHPQGQGSRPGSKAAAVGWPTRTVLAAGFVPLVLPGLVVGFLSLRRARAAGSSQRASWLAIAASLAWAVVLVVIVASGSGSSAGGCTGYPVAVRHAYAKVMADFTDRAPASVQAADLGVAVTGANASAAGAGQIAVRSALSAMAGDLEQARADVTAHGAVPAALRQHLAADGAALASCTA